MSMKKIVAAVCMFALAGGLLTGCSDNSSTTTTTESTESTATTESTESTESTAAATATTADGTTVTAPEADVEMQYITPADVEANLENDSYLVVDLRKAEDYATAHIPGAISADMDACVNGDFANGVETLSAALKEATGAENGGDKTLVLVCYSGKKYAQAGTNVVSALGGNMENVYTLEGGMKAWTGATEA